MPDLMFAAIIGTGSGFIGSFVAQYVMYKNYQRSQRERKN